MCLFDLFATVVKIILLNLTPCMCVCLFIQVLVPKKPEFKGKMIEVDIYETGKHFMKGQPVGDANVFTPSIAKPLEKGEVSGLIHVSTFSNV